MVGSEILSEAQRDITPEQAAKLLKKLSEVHFNVEQLQVYILPARNSVAVEPMTCNIDAFNNHDGLIVLEAGQDFKAEYGVKVL